jgi:hypothetical protein
MSAGTLGADDRINLASSIEHDIGFGEIKVEAPSGKALLTQH